MNVSTNQLTGKPAKGVGETCRQCTVTRVIRPPSELIRFVVDPEGAVVPDLRCRLPGRGVWITCAHDLVAEAVGKSHFARAFKRAVEVDDDLSQRVEGVLSKAALSRLSLANKAGEVVAGFAKVEKVLASGNAAGLLHALEAADGGCHKLGAKFLKNRHAHGTSGFILRGFNVDELSLALGLPNVVHAAAIEGRMSHPFFEAAARLEMYRAGRAGLTVPVMAGFGEA